MIHLHFILLSRQNSKQEWIQILFSKQIDFGWESDIFQFFFFLAFCWVAKQFTVTHQKDSTKDVHGWKTSGAGDPKSQGRYTIFEFSCIFLQVFFNLSWGSFVKSPHLSQTPSFPPPPTVCIYEFNRQPHFTTIRMENSLSHNLLLNHL
jgi:hypothetical protein